MKSRFRYSLVTAFSLLNLFGEPQTVRGQQILEQLARARQLIVEGHYEEAQKSLEEFAGIHSGDSRIYNLLGVANAGRGQYRAAEANLIKAIDLDGRYPDAYLNLGRLYQENLGQDDGARGKGIAVYSRLLALDPEHVEANFQISVLLHLGGEYGRSLEYLERLPTADQSRAQALALICANNAALGRSSRASEMADRLANDPTLVEEDVLFVLPALRKCDRDDLVLKLLESLAGRNALSIPTHERLGLLYASLGEFLRARAHLESLVARHPNLPGLLTALAWVSFQAGSYERTLSYLAHAKDLAPADGRIHLLYGLACVELRLGVEAVTSLEKALSLEPDNPYFNYAYAVAVLYWREPAEAIPGFQKFLEAFQGDPRGEVGLAQAHFLNKEYETAMKGFEKVTADPGFAAVAHFYLGAIANLDLRRDDAVLHLEKALELRPDYSDAMAELGAVLVKQGELERASTLLHRAIEITPEHYLANFNLLALYARSKDERYEAQKEQFEKVKEERWEELSESLRSIEIVPRNVFSDFTRDGGKAGPP